MAGGSAIASNMGFLLNKTLVLVPTGPATQTGNNWTSIPYRNSYGTINGFCHQTGLVTTGLVRTQITTLNYLSDTEGFKTYNCGATSPPSPPLIPGKGLQIRQPNVPGAATHIIIAGSHDPVLRITIKKLSNYWFSVPYHTTWVTGFDICSEVGLTNTGITRGSITRLNAGPPAAFQTITCGADTGRLNLVLGEMIQLREPRKEITFTPAHY